MIMFHGCNNTDLEYDEKSVFITHRPTLFSEEIVEFMSTDDILFVYRELPAFLKNGTLSIILLSCFERRMFSLRAIIRRCVIFRIIISGLPCWPKDSRDTISRRCWSGCGPMKCFSSVVPAGNISEFN